MDKNIVTYSGAMSVHLSRICAGLCSYCNYPQNKLDQSGYELMVPYATIKMCNAAKKQGVKEVRFVSGDRPDNFAAVRARLDLWGFHSYIEYVHTVCELVFLEGLIPSIDIGYVTKEELSVIRRMSAAIVCMLDTVDDHILTKFAPTRTLNSRLEVIKNAGEGKVPVTTGILVGMGESVKSRKDAMTIIKHMHEKYGNIQNVVIQNYVPQKGMIEAIKNGPSQKEMLETVEMARTVLPADIQITVPAVYNQDIMPFVKLGVRDIGLFDITPDKTLDVDKDKLLATIEKQLKKEGLGLQRRLPIFSKYIAENWYSRKLAQVLDKYKDMLKNAEGKNVSAEDTDDEDDDFSALEKPVKKVETKTEVKEPKEPKVKKTPVKPKAKKKA